MEYCAQNTDIEIWREVKDDYYSPSISVTKDNKISIHVGGLVKVKTVKEWFQPTVWLDKPNEEGWWWFEWAESKRIEPRWVAESMRGFLVESYEETEDRDYFKCQMQPVTSYKGKWAKAELPTKE